MPINRSPIMKPQREPGTTKGNRNTMTTQEKAQDKGKVSSKSLLDMDIETDPISLTSTVLERLQVPLTPNVPSEPRARLGSASSFASACSQLSSGSGKRKRSVPDIESGAEKEHTAIALMAGIQEQLQDCLENPSNKFNRSAAAKINEHFQAAWKIVADLCVDNAVLKGRQAEQEQRRASDSPAHKRTYVEVVGGARQTEPKPAPIVGAGMSKSAIKARQPVRSYTVMVSAGDKAKSTHDVKTALKKAIDPVTSAIRVDRVRTSKSGALFIDAHTKQDLEKIKGCRAIADAGLVASIPSKRRPRLIVYDVPAELTAQAFAEAVLKQNAPLFEGLAANTFAPKIRDSLRKASRIYVGWTRCRVLDYLSMTRCYNCLDLGHAAKFCRAKEKVCAHCAGAGHSKADCKKRDSPKACALCKKLGKPHAHAVDDKECPSYKITMERYKASIDYGP